jgi:hypothetical protein
MDIWDLLMGSEPDAEAQAAAIAARLRGQKTLGIAASMAGPVAAPAAKMLESDAAAQERELGRATEARYKFGDVVAARKSQAAALAAPETSQAYRDLLSELGRPVDPNTPVQTLQALLPIAQKIHAERVRREEKRTGPGGIDDPQAIAIADSIIRGEQPPDTKGLYRFAGPVRAQLAKQGYDLTSANLDWQATSKHMATLNGPQQVRLRQSIDFASHSLDQIENLYNQWQQVGPASGFKVLNKGALLAARNLPGEAGAVAQGLIGQINDLTESLGSVYMGGNTPTDNAFKLAQQNLQADWNEDTFKKSLGLVRNNLRMRSNSMLHSTPAGLSPGSRFGGGGDGGAAPGPALGGGAPAGGPVQVNSKAERDALPPGTHYTRPGDPTVYTKGQ